MKTQSHRHASLHSKRAGALLVAIGFTAISALVVGSFIQLSNHELRISNSQFYSNQALNLAEAGLDEAMHAINFTNWSGWTVTGNDALFSARNLQLGRAASGHIHVLIENRHSASPRITAEGLVTLTGASALTTSRQVRIDLRRRSFFENGLTGGRITFTGGSATVASYRSSQGRFHMSRRRDNGRVAAYEVVVDALSLGNSDIWGWAFVNGMAGLRVGGSGTILGADSAARGFTQIDWTRVSTDFQAQLPPPLPTPTTVDFTIGTGTINNSLTLPRPGDTLPIGRPVVYEVNNINLSGSNALRITGDVILIVDNDIRLRGSSSIQVAQNGRLRVHAYGNIDSGGNSLVNSTGVPANMILFGMGDARRSFRLGGSTQWEAGVYAPNADILMHGSVDMAGAVVGRTVELQGNVNFHYDEDLASFGSDGLSFAMNSWRELLTPGERINFQARLGIN